MYWTGKTMDENFKYILNFTPTGLIPTKGMTPNVQVEPDEIVAQVLEAAELGQIWFIFMHVIWKRVGQVAARKCIRR